MADDFAPLPSADAVAAEPAPDVSGLIIADALRDAIWTAEATTERSLQAAVGWSQIGNACSRQLTFSLAGTPVSNRPDPLKAMVGTGGHLVLAEHFKRMDKGMGRYLVEQKLSYRGVPGTVDLADRRRKLVIDWKFKPLAKIKRLKREGVENSSPGYVVQAHGYGAALSAAGEDIESVGLVFVPTDATLDDIYVWNAPLNVAVADEAITKLDALRGFEPQQIPAKPGPLCPWCPYFRAGWTGDPNVACPGDIAKHGRK